MPTIAQVLSTAFHRAAEHMLRIAKPPFAISSSSFFPQQLGWEEAYLPLLESWRCYHRLYTESGLAFSLYIFILFRLPCQLQSRIVNLFLAKEVETIEFWRQKELLPTRANGHLYLFKPEVETYLPLRLL
ncbi:hypothetical protein ES703_47103 [subsurface metagenome]